MRGLFPTTCPIALTTEAYRRIAQIHRPPGRATVMRILGAAELGDTHIKRQNIEDDLHHNRNNRAAARTASH